MIGKREGSWTVLIITRTKNGGAVAEWVASLEGRECRVLVDEPDKLWDHLKKGGIDAFMLDDVFPPDTPEMRQLAQVLTRIRPEPAIVFLVARWDDYHHLCDLVDGRALLHRDNGPNMDDVYQYLAGQMKGDETALLVGY